MAGGLGGRGNRSRCKNTEFRKYWAGKALVAALDGAMKKPPFGKLIEEKPKRCHQHRRWVGKVARLPGTGSSAGKEDLRLLPEYLVARSMRLAAEKKKN